MIVVIREKKTSGVLTHDREIFSDTFFNLACEIAILFSNMVVSGIKKQSFE